MQQATVSVSPKTGNSGLKRTKSGRLVRLSDRSEFVFQLVGNAGKVTNKKGVDIGEIAIVLAFWFIAIGEDAGEVISMVEDIDADVDEDVVIVPTWSVTVGTEVYQLIPA